MTMMSITVAHSPLLDYIAYADLDAVRSIEPRFFDVAGLDEFGHARVPILYSIESALRNYEDAFQTRVAIAVDMARRFREYSNSGRITNDLLGRSYPDGIIGRVFPYIGNYPTRNVDYRRGGGGTGGKHAPDIFASPNQQYHDDHDDGNEEEDAFSCSAYKGGDYGPDVPSDMRLAWHLIKALLLDGGAFAGVGTNALEKAVKHGFYELLPLLVKVGGARFDEGEDATGSKAFKYLFEWKRMPPFRVMETLKVLAALGDSHQLNTHVLLSSTCAFYGMPILHRVVDSDPRQPEFMQRNTQYLLQMGADPFRTDRSGRTAQYWMRTAVEKCEDAIVKHTDSNRGVITPVSQSFAAMLRGDLDHTRAAEDTLLRAINLRHCALACMMATSSRLGARSWLHALEPSMLRDIVEAGCRLSF